MQSARVAEFDLIDLIRARCAHARADVRLGIGDDAALLTVPPGQVLAVSTDTLVDGIHFPKDTAPADLGWKSLAVNLSDLAAMGATPAWATLALTLPQADPGWVGEFADGFAALAHEHDVALVGGDTTQGPLSITVTVHGFVREDAALRRSAAQIGDIVCVTGTLGDAAAGLRMLRDSGFGTRNSEKQALSPDTLYRGGGGMGEGAPLALVPELAALIARLNRPTPRIAQGLILASRAHACIDVSDGLVADLGHICRASGVGAEVDADALPTSPVLAARFGRDDRRALQLAGGDDYELCFTVAESAIEKLLADLARSGCAATRVGRIVAGAGARVHDASGKVIDTPRAGWQHFTA